MASKGDDITGACLCHTVSAPSSVLACRFPVSVCMRASSQSCFSSADDGPDVIKSHNDLFKTTSESNHDPVNSHGFAARSIAVCERDAHKDDLKAF